MTLHPSSKPRFIVRPPIVNAHKGHGIRARGRIPFGELSPDLIEHFSHGLLDVLMEYKLLVGPLHVLDKVLDVARVATESRLGAVFGPGNQS